MVCATENEVTLSEITQSLAIPPRVQFTVLPEKCHIFTFLDYAQRS